MSNAQCKTGAKMSAVRNRIIVASLIGVWALIGLQRFAPGFVAPFVVSEFSMTNTQWGLVTGVLAFSWAFGALFAGVLTDRYGAKPTLLVAGLISSILGWTVGLVQSLVQLIAVRLLLGAAEGAIWPAVTSAATQIVAPHLRGRLVAILIASFLIVGVVIGAPVITIIGQSLGWRRAFYLVSIPLFLLITLLWKLMSNVQPGRTSTAERDPSAASWTALLGSRNLLLAAAISVCFISRIFIVTAFATLYLTSTHQLSIATAGKVLGASLFGDVVGTLLFGWLADKTGQRKSLVITLSALAALAGTTFAMLPAGSSMASLIAALFLFTLFSGGVIPLMLVIIPTESVPPTLTASAIGFVNFAGEFFGAGLFPIVGGLIGDLLGLRFTLLLGALLAALAALLGLALIDPRRNARLPVPGCP